MNFSRFLPNQKWQRCLAEKGVEDERMGTLPVVGIGRDQGLVARLLPPVFYDLDPEWDGLLLVEHEWGRWPNKIRTVCPIETHAPLLAPAKRKLKECPACAAGVPARVGILFHAALDDNLHGVALRLDVRDFPTLAQIIQAGALSFKDGYKVELWREGWKLNYRKLEPVPIDRDDFENWLAVMHINLYPHAVKAELLQFMADAFQGWNKAGQPDPQPCQHKALVELLPQATLLDIPWGFKAPQRFGWRDTPYSLMSNRDYLRSLACGNIGLRCGLIRNGPDGVLVIIGLDADSDEFAAELEELNPWLASTFCVRGKRGKKWFFIIEGPRAAEACARSTKIKRGDKDVGDWLGEGKQGVILGLHPSGCFYEHNRLQLTTISPADFTLPGDCRFARTPEVQPRFKGGGWVDDRNEYRSVSERIIQSALNFIPADERDVWFTVACALKTWGYHTGREETARQLWDEWSAQSQKYDEGGQEKLWQSLGHRNQDVITPGSLFWLAHNNGWSRSDDDGDQT